MSTIPQRLREIANDVHEHGLTGSYARLRIIAAELEAPAADAAPVKWQGGLDNEQLRAAFKRKLPAVEPTDRDLTCFALGVEVGKSIDSSSWNRLHHVIHKHGLHPGRTDDDMIDITDTALAAVAALQARINALEAAICAALGATSWQKRIDHLDDPTDFAERCAATEQVADMYNALTAVTLPQPDTRKEQP